MTESRTKRVFVKTYGCQMNVYDSERMTDALAADGYVATDAAETADLVILNTCHIREKASEKVYSDLGRMRVLRDEARAVGRDMVIGVAGCVAQAEGGEIARRAREVDFVVGPQAYQRLPEILGEVAAGARPVATDFAVAEKFATLPSRHPSREGRFSAFLTVQEGCDKFCTFCVVPYTRGAEVSRPLAQIVAEARVLVGQGVREITLLGQNVNAWHADGPDGRAWGLGRLLRHLAEIDGLYRLRYTTSHPRDMDDELIEAHRDLPVLMPYLHLPVQSGSDRVLAAMNRRHDRADYFRLVDRIREADPEIALSGDFIVGFPGETESDFADTLSLIDEIGYASAFSFKYSPRPGTPASLRADQVDEAVKTMRIHELQERIRAGADRFAAAQVGKQVSVLFERKGKRPGQVVGRSPWLSPVHVDGSETLIGTLQPVALTSLGTNSFFGDLVGAKRMAEVAA